MDDPTSSQTTHARPGPWQRWILAVLLLPIAWRGVAELRRQAGVLAAVPVAELKHAVTTDFGGRLRETVDDDAELYLAVLRHLPRDARLVLLCDITEAPLRTRERMALMQARFACLLFPTPVTICFGPVPASHVTALESQVDRGFFLLNTRPEIPPPLPNRWRIVASGEAFDLLQYEGESG